MMKRFRSEKGFTLVELLVVIAVLAILAAVAIPRLSGVRDKAYEAEADHALDAFKTGLEMYYAEFAEYPVTGDFATLIGDQYLPDQYDSTSGVYSGSNQSKWTVTYDNDDGGETFSIEMELTGLDGAVAPDIPDITVTLNHNETNGYY